VHLKQNNRLTGRRISAVVAMAAVTTCGGAALAPAAFASTAAPATTHSTAHSAAVHPETINECYQMLQLYLYTVTVARGFACAVAATAPVSEAAKIASCAFLMGVAGVTPYVAGLACTVATAPG
jgi:hypothetical protein